MATYTLIKQLPVKSFVLVLAMVFLAVSCKKKKETDPAADYDSKEMLGNIGSTIFVPRYNDVKLKSTALQTAAASFTAAPDLSTLLEVQNKYKEARLSWEGIEIAEFGPASDKILRSSVNYFPSDTVKIKNNIVSGSYDLEAATNYTAKGFSAVEYLLFGVAATNADILLMYTSETNAANRKNYLTNLIGNMVPKIAYAADTWNTTYLSTFSNSTGTDQGSSMSLMVNSMSMGLEMVRRERIGNPLGYVGLTNSGTVYPKLQEAYYSNTSKELAIEYLIKSKELFNGGSGNGLDDYLNFINAKYDNGNLLSNEINSQFDLAIAAVQALTPDYTTILATDKPKAEAAFLELKKLTVLIKLDMASQLGVVINYTDNDGD